MFSAMPGSLRAHLSCFDGSNHLLRTTQATFVSNQISSGRSCLVMSAWFSAMIKLCARACVCICIDRYRDTSVYIEISMYGIYVNLI